MNWSTWTLQRWFFEPRSNHALPSLAGLHTPNEDQWFFRERVFRTCEVWGAFDGTAMTGMIAFRESWIDQLYVLPKAQGRGIGTELLQVAQRCFDHLQLWTFQRNVRARRFYEARGFALVQKTDGAGNEEKEPDALYRWTRSRLPVVITQRFSPKDISRPRARPRTIQVHGPAR
jgi:GNAT superfamily N-acetyltransferase